jgi:hypothetical protein
MIRGRITSRGMARAGELDRAMSSNRDWKFWVAVRLAAFNRTRDNARLHLGIEEFSR